MLVGKLQLSTIPDCTLQLLSTPDFVVLTHLRERARAFVSLLAPVYASITVAIALTKTLRVGSSCVFFTDLPGAACLFASPLSILVACACFGALVFVSHATFEGAFVLEIDASAGPTTMFRLLQMSTLSWRTCDLGSAPLSSVQASSTGAASRFVTEVATECALLAEMIACAGH